jgi:hypothetical protein
MLLRAAACLACEPQRPAVTLTAPQRPAKIDLNSSQELTK